MKAMTQTYQLGAPQLRLALPEFENKTLRQWLNRPDLPATTPLR